MNLARRKNSKQSHPSSGSSETIDDRRLRTTLRLCFAPAQADALAARVRLDETDPRRALAPVVRLARMSYSSARWLAPFRPSRGSADRALPLRPRPGLPALPALALVLHLGLNLDIDTLAALFGHSAGAIAAALQRARHAVDPNQPHPCPDFVAPIGRYRDPVVERLDERLAVMQHVATCKRCQYALDQARHLDDRLLAIIAHHECELPPMPGSGAARRALWLGPALLWGGLTLLVVALPLTGLIGSRRLLADEHAPVPLLAASATNSALSGWLIEATQAGNVSAVNVATGAVRSLIPSQANDRADKAVSPDGKHIAH